jgi:hypothetical protein
MQDTEQNRLLIFNKSMKKFCALEQSAIHTRIKLLSTLEASVAKQSVVDDIQVFINQSKQTELTHKYTNALQLMDYFYHQKFLLLFLNKKII